MSCFFGLFDKARPLNFERMVDWHSHILPGVDDGVKTLEQSLEILERYRQLGIRKVWLTPHIMEDVPNETQVLRERFNDLKAVYTGEIELRLSAENMMDNLFARRLDKGDLLPAGDSGDMLLIETSYFNAPQHFHATLQRVLSAGYRPLLAHPERYMYIHSMKEYVKLKEMGVKFQLNLLSLAGAYGHHVMQKAKKMLSMGLYDHCGSDLHDIRQIDTLMGLRLTSKQMKALPDITI